MELFDNYNIEIPSSLLNIKLIDLKNKIQYLKDNNISICLKKDNKYVLNPLIYDNNCAIIRK